ncbi:MAG: glutamine--tRNA ligase [Flavobacteriaceae bacterium]|nr:glutamine--tRNA ligase [Flavobacteriaceae bacterium]|tara:strand:- start:24856 stop:26529 length:1674 start_codon:yes stop_codon:yes gene_type:complete
MDKKDRSLNFIESIIEEDLKNGLKREDLRFRFPPEPNGYLHIGHIKAICLNFNLGQKYGAAVNLRFDDTNPQNEESKYVTAIKNDVNWLGYSWDKECFASDYFEQLFEWAKYLIDEGLAYVDSQSSEEIAYQKGTPTTPGKNSPYRERSIGESKNIFQEMANGKHPEGTHVLRAKIDMESPNMLLRDPVIYRVLNKSHHRTGNKWRVYPMYDWTHGQSDYLEQITHSLCTLEFKPHRDLYQWFLKSLPIEKRLPEQTEFARLNLSYTVTSKRKLKQLIDLKLVSSWDDPRMPTISGLRRRGYTPEALKNFVNIAGIAKRENIIEASLLEFCARDHLNKIAPRVNAVLNPIKLTIVNYEEGSETLEGEVNPESTINKVREIPFSKHLYIEKEDFREEPNRKFFRLSLGKEVRLKNAYIIRGESVIKDKSGNITEVLCTYDKGSKSGSGSEASKRKVKGTLHWVCRHQAIKVKVNLYDRLFNDPAPDQHENKSFLDFFNPNSLEEIFAFAEPSIQSALPGQLYQFQRLGYFCVDTRSKSGSLVFNRTVGLRDNWPKTKN